MLRVHESKSGAAAVKYLDEGLARDDYYNNAREIKGRWMGEGARLLKLSGQVERDDFVALVNNRDPNTGKRLTPRNKADRRPGYDATLSAWKSASVMAGVYGCSDIRQAFWDAGDEMMTEAAEPEMRTRVRIKGRDEDRITGNMIVAAYRHFNTRPVDGKSDCHDHTHYYIVNATHDPVETRFKAAQLGDLKAKAPDLELEFDARFAKRLLALGYVPEMGKTGVQIKGVPQSVIDKFSRASKRIEKEAAAQGVSDGISKHRIAAKLRESKKADLPADRLMADWQSRLTDSEREALGKVANKEMERGPDITPSEATRFAIDHLFQREDVVTERRLRKTAVHYGIGYVTPGEVDREIAAALKRGEIMAKDGKKGRSFVKTASLRDQCKMTQLARDGRGQCEPLTAAYEDAPELSQEQNAAARMVAESRDRYVGLRGPAGTGKSYSIKAVAAVVDQRRARGEERLIRALALAPSSSASRGELRRAGFRDATTLAAFLESEKLQSDMRQQLLIVDEAGMMSTKDMIRLMDIAERNDMRVWFVGDYRQHASVDAGDSFRLLRAEGGLKYAELSENRRQKSAAHREAVNRMATGSGKEIVKGFEQLDRMGAVVVEPDREKLRQRLADAFLETKDEGKTALIITPTNAEAGRLTAELRRALRERGRITGDEQVVPVRNATYWTEAQKRDGRLYEPGMVVEFHKAVPGVRHSVEGRRETSGGFERGEAAVVMKGRAQVVLMRRDGRQALLPDGYADRFQVYRTSEQALARGDQIRITKNGEAKVKGQAAGTRVNNGDVYPIEGWTKEGDMRLPGGKILPRNFSHIALGYAVTSHRSQGATVDREFVDWDRDSLTPVDTRAAYVTSSRFRESITYFVNDRESVKAVMQRGGERVSALEFMKDRIGEEKVTVRRRFGLHRHLEQNRVARYLKGRVEAMRETARSLVKSWRGRGGMQYA
jgi:conjugative relaxase-like TrwC/TraI family protein